VDALAERRDELDAFLAGHSAHRRPFWLPIHTQKNIGDPTTVLGSSVFSKDEDQLGIG
jgi:hypothetical protein